MHLAEDEADRDGGDGKPVAPREEPDHAEDEHDPGVEERGIQRVGADDGKREHHRPPDGGRDKRDAGEELRGEDRSSDLAASRGGRRLLLDVDVLRVAGCRLRTNLNAEEQGDTQRQGCRDADDDKYTAERLQQRDAEGVQQLLRH